MSLSGRWSLFSRAVKEEKEKQEHGEIESNKDGGDNEIVLSSKEEEVVVKDKTVVESSCNTEHDGVKTDNGVNTENSGADV